METTLHRQLKALYAGDATQQEVSIAGFRIDAVVGGTLVEIQQASLGALRDKVRKLLENYDVQVIKPVPVCTRLIKQDRRGRPIGSPRVSPKHCTSLHLFEDLVHFVTVFPHPRLTLEVLLTDQEEYRMPIKPRRWRSKPYRLVDRKLVGIQQRIRLRSAADLQRMLPAGLPQEFTTADLAREAAIPRWLAQKMAFCLQKSGAAHVVSKQRNAIVYSVRRPRRSAA